MKNETISYEVRDGVAWISLRRPDKMNALTPDMAASLAQAWARLEADDTARVAVLRAEGRAFCAGADLAGVQDSADAQGMTPRLRMVQALPRNGIDVFKPIVGCVQGYALGIGYVLAVKGCDITLAGESALFGYPESVAGIASQPLEHTPYLPFKPSLEFLLLAWKGGKLMDAQRAWQLGMVNDVVPDAELESRALERAEMLKQVPPLYIRAIKRGHYRSIDTSRAQADRDFLDYVMPQETSEASLAARQRHASRKPRS
jgi:enoyl-CoA hydratase/carnithine racemase